MSAHNLVSLLDLNDNGRLAMPDLMGWVLFGTVGVLSVLVLTGVLFTGVVGAGHGVAAAGRVAMRGVARVVAAAAGRLGR